MDRAGDPWIRYQDLRHMILKFAGESGGLWTNETADSSVNGCACSSLALDPSGNPRIR